MTDRSDFSLIEVLKFTWKKRVVLAIVTFIGGIVALIVSFMIPEMYKSSAVIFPNDGVTVSSAMDLKLYGGRNLIFGKDDEAEQMLQVLRSERIRGPICEKYQLMDHYRIKKDSKNASTKLYNKYFKNISFKKTSFMSIQIEVKDENPKYASEIANDIVMLADTVSNDIRRSMAKATHDAIKVVYDKFEDQSQKLISSMEGMTKDELLSEGLPMLVGYYHQSYLRDQLYLKYAESIAEVESTVPSNFVVSWAYTPDYKFYPKKSVIIVVSAFLTFIFTLTLLLIKENFAKYFKEED